VAKSDHSTGNSSFASYVLKSNELTFIFTAPYSRQAAPADSAPAVPSYKQDDIYAFVNKHGLAVRAVGEVNSRHYGQYCAFDCDAQTEHKNLAAQSGNLCPAAGISVEDAKQAFEVAVQNGGKPVHPPSVLKSSDGQESVMAEVHMYGDVVMRFMSGTFKVLLSAHCAMSMHLCIVLLLSCALTRPKCLLCIGTHVCLHQLQLGQSNNVLPGVGMPAEPARLHRFTLFAGIGAFFANL